MQHCVLEFDYSHASTGIAANRMLAKICGNVNKPNGQKLLERDADVIRIFMRELPLVKVALLQLRRIQFWRRLQVNGIGPATSALLQSLDIHKGVDVFEKLDKLWHAFSDSSKHFIVRAALGISRNTLVSHRTEYMQSSMSREHSFRDISDVEEMYKIIDELCAKLEKDASKRRVRVR